MAVEVRESPTVGNRSLFHDRGYFQRSARRANGDTVFITGDSRSEVENCRRLLMRLARRHHLMMIEIAELAGVPTGRMAKMPALALVETTSALAPLSEVETRLTAIHADNAVINSGPIPVGLFLDLCPRMEQNTLWLIDHSSPEEAAAMTGVLKWFQEEILAALEANGLLDD
jgi:hypothetical protein